MRLTVDELEPLTLNAAEGYQAMYLFLVDYFDRTKGSAAVASVIGDMEIESDGSSTDPAALSDWESCVQRVIAGRAQA